MAGYRDMIASQLARRRTGGIALPSMPALGTSPAAMVAAAPVVGTPAHRPPATVAEPNPFNAAMRNADPDMRPGTETPIEAANRTAKNWGEALRSIGSRWTTADPIDAEEELLYGDRPMGPR